MQPLINQAITPFSGKPGVSAIVLCGSVNRQRNDTISDIDLFVFHRHSVALSVSYIAENFPITDCTIQQKAHDVEQNYVLEGRIINVKHFSVTFAQQYSDGLLRWDDMSLEQTENLVTMRVIEDLDGIITQCQRALTVSFTEQHDRLAREMTDHFGNLLWRSVYQGVYRDETHSSYIMLSECRMLLTKLCYLSNGIMPAPLKWRFSDKCLGSLQGGEAVKRISECLNKLDHADKEQLVAFYATLKQYEGDAAGLSQSWWWNVFAPDRLQAVNISDATRNLLIKHELITA